MEISFFFVVLMNYVYFGISLNSAEINFIKHIKIPSNVADNLHTPHHTLAINHSKTSELAFYHGQCRVIILYCEFKISHFSFEV
jgi:hypothetical protein